MHQIDSVATEQADGGHRRRVILGFIALFWIAQVSILTLQRVFVAGELMTELLAPRLAVTLVAILYSIGLAELLARLDLDRLWLRLTVGFAAAIIGCVIHAVCNFFLFRLLAPMTVAFPITPADYAAPLLQWLWSYAAMAATLLAISHSMALRHQEQRVSAFQRASHAAQLRSLRLQLNPHFMFNALNSVAALIGKRSLDDAEEMVETLSDFLRSSLEMAPEEKVTLVREIELQRLYLDVESIRFSDRLSVAYEIDPECGPAIVPGLITQPIIENVIRHAVAPSIARVVLTISARRDGEWLRIRVANSAGGGKRQGRRGTGIGLSNVALRLRGYYGERCSFEAGADPAGGYAVTLTLPYALEN